MWKYRFRLKTLVVFYILHSFTISGQIIDSVWTLQKCIDQAMQKNISIQERSLSNQTSQVQELQARAERFPSLNASVSQNFQWSKQVNLENSYGNYEGMNGTTFGVNSSVVLYNGLRIKNSIKQAELSYQSGSYDVEALKESVSLQVLTAYLQVLYSEEEVKNTQKQIESTSQQLSLSEERLRLGSIARSDYLQVKSELATENYTLASAQNQLAVNQVTLMQLMEIPVSPDFKIQHPEFDISKGYQDNINSDSIYQLALGIKPQVKSSALNKQIAELEISIAKAGYQPSLSLSAGINSSYQSGGANTYTNQLMNQLVPSVGIHLSIPIYQNRQLKSSVAMAMIGISDASLQELNTKNQLRKNIEQATVDFNSAIIKYQASDEKFNSSKESYDVAQEKFNQGLLNSVDFLIQKTNLINAESELLQAKYNLVFSKKIIDFYAGIPLTF